MNDQIGVINCFCCDERVPVRSQKNKLAMISCSWCGMQLYARATHAHAKIVAKMKPVEVASPPADDKKEAKPPRKETPPPKDDKRGGSLLDNL